MTMMIAYRLRSSYESRLMLTRRPPASVSCGDWQILSGRRRTLLASAAPAIRASTSSSRSGRQTFQPENISVELRAATTTTTRQTASERGRREQRLDRVTERWGPDATTTAAVWHRLHAARTLLNILSCARRIYTYNNVQNSDISRIFLFDVFFPFLALPFLPLSSSSTSSISSSSLSWSGL